MSLSSKDAPQFTGDPYVYLALTVVADAVKDARRGSTYAKIWLREEGYFWLAGCGVDVDLDYWDVWVSMGCPKEGKRQWIKKQGRSQEAMPGRNG